MLKKTNKKTTTLMEVIVHTHSLTVHKVALRIRQIQHLPKVCDYFTG